MRTAASERPLRSACEGEGQGYAKKYRLGAYAFLLSCFLPYLAVPIGANTAVPATMLIGLALVAAVRHFPRLIATMFTLTAAMLCLAFVQLLLGRGVALVAIVTGISIIAMLTGAAAVVIILRSRLTPALSWMVIVNCAYALVQKYVFLDNGTIPFIDYYSTPGFASVAAQAEVITTYIRRPFGLFPEPSFLAGSTALALVGVAVVGHSFSKSLPRASYIAFAVGCITIAVSGSGSSVISLICVALIYLMPLMRKSWIAVLAAPVGVTIAVVAGVSILDDRLSASANWSWQDRVASIQAGFNVLLSDWTALLFGVGRGKATLHLSDGNFYAGLSGYVHALSDVASALFRFVVEFGAPAGVALLIFLSFQVLSHGGGAPLGTRILALVVWVTVGGLTITYDQAAFIWLLPGVCMALRWLEERVREAPSGIKS